MTPLVISPLGDSAITVTLGEGISEELSRRVVAQASRLRDAEIIGVTDIVPSYAVLSVHYDPLTIVFDDLRDRVASVIDEQLASVPRENESELHLIKVRYDGEDLDEVARRTELTTDEVIRIHGEREYRVYVIGFVPGFAYLGTLDDRLVLPRREAPRKRVPPGSVAIAERQTGIYPSATPGGWHLIGTTDATLFEPSSDRPALLSVGDRVKFVQ
jgi:KipI family sensor histidine kinase inhibitor